jgi:hypothetical protein
MTLNICTTIAVLLLPHSYHEAIVTNRLLGEWQLSRHLLLGHYSKEDIEAVDLITKQWPLKFTFSNQGKGFVTSVTEAIDNGNEPPEIVETKTIRFNYCTQLLSPAPILLIYTVIREDDESRLLSFVYLKSTLWLVSVRFDYLLDRLLGKKSGEPLDIMEFKKLQTAQKPNGSLKTDLVLRLKRFAREFTSPESKHGFLHSQRKAEC